MRMWELITADGLHNFFRKTSDNPLDIETRTKSEVNFHQTIKLNDTNYSNRLIIANNSTSKYASLKAVI